MISIEDRQQFAKAEAKAREVKPRVWSLTFGSYMVEGHDKDYRVTFSKDNNGHWQAECNCPAHTKSSAPRPCYHIPASYGLMKIQIGIKQQVRAAEAALVPSVADWTINEKEAA
jgi:hypothetical protein